MKKIISILVLSISLVSYGQVKIGDNPTTINPSSALEVESTNKALLITRVDNTSLVTNPVNGMMVYDKSSQCIRSFENGKWSTCLTAEPSVIDVSCAILNTIYTAKSTNEISTKPIFRVTLTNTSLFFPVSLYFATSNVALSGVSGLSVTSVTSSFVTIQPGQQATIDYIIEGTATASGTLTATWTNKNLSCSSTHSVRYFPITNARGANSTTAVEPDNGWHWVSLLQGSPVQSQVGPYGIYQVDMYASTYLDGNLFVWGRTLEDKLNTSNSVVYASDLNDNYPVTTFGAYSGQGIGADNQFHRVVCPDNTIATGIEIRATTYLDGNLKLRCTALNPGYTTEVGSGGVDVEGPGIGYDNNTHSVSCPPGQFVKGIRIYATTYLDGRVGLFCTPVN
ncbi:hypothetical protein [Flavobacterium sp.]|uniref:hypothetical protein n=1 Tax=Flavobacterium sp. TaxID=239 RepID=UPI0026068849|nr:hypothetical protein [Flavobacterium sp.]